MRVFIAIFFLSLSITLTGRTRLYDDSKISPLFDYLDMHIWDLMDQGDYDNAEIKAIRLLEYSKKINDPYILANAHNTLGIVLTYSGKYPDALGNLFTALPLFEDLRDTIKIANVYNNLGAAYYEQKKLKEALDMYVKATHFLEFTNYLPGISASANNVGLVYSDLHDQKKALEYFQKSFLIDSAASNIDGVALSHLNFGRAYFDMKLYDKAMKEFEKGLATSGEVNDTYTLSKLLLNAARIDMIRNNYDAAAQKIRRAFQFSHDDENHAEMSDLYFSQHELDSCMQDFGKAYSSYRKFIFYRDRLTNIENAQRSAEAKIQYAYDKKQSEFKAEQEKKDLIKEQERQKQVVIRNFLGLGFLLLLALAGVIFRSYHNKKKAHLEISRQKEEVSHQKELVEEKNREIVDSITYAKRLQGAILPPLTQIRAALPESFIFYRPKDIVAGDFYFFEQIDSKLFIAIADCTGHGVPGAMVSVICSTALSRAVKEFKLIDPGMILDKVTDLVLETFEKSESVVSDGMDISLLVLDKPDSAASSFAASFSGANNSIYIKKEGSEELHEIKGDKQPVGRFEKRSSFTSNVITLEKGDRIYLSTDGYPDQFGGEKGKKFKYAQLKEMLVETSCLKADQQMRAVEDRFQSWKGHHEQTDDVTLLGIRI